ncbi:MAG: DUF4097 family beta strand repeat protein [Phycisphaerales bacterium]|nr:MAG: DUF4097 family beta strand repeat protein [Phycisphaerales bacterium]
MKNRVYPKVLLGCALCFLVTVAGCCINIGDSCRAKYERTEQLSASMADLDSLDVKTSFGSITITGADTTMCSIEARIQAQAPTTEEAQQLAEDTKIVVVPTGKTLEIRVDRPHLRNNRSVGVSFDITVPRQTGITCYTSYGSINLTDLKGTINARSSYASITTENTEGRVELETSYGNITCNNITSANISARTSYGSVDVSCSPATAADMNANVATSYGGIEFETPPGFAGEVDLQTSFGSINTDLPITIKGGISKNHIRGVVGQGNARLRLKTSFGSIRVR